LEFFSSEFKGFLVLLSVWQSVQMDFVDGNELGRMRIDQEMLMEDLLEG
jgi:hypothetical protein